MYRFGKLTFVCCLLLLPSAVCQAQYVQWGPGGAVRVRAPFVRVDVSPHGGTYVRAPFTSVYSPWYGGVVRYYQYPAGPYVEYGAQPATGMPPEAGMQPEANAAEMDWGQLRKHLREATTRLEGELSGLQGRAKWQTALRPGTIRDLLAEDSDQPPDMATGQQLMAILQGYDAMAADKNAQQVTQLASFRAVHAALIELTSPPIERKRRDLAVQWLTLNQELGQFQTADSWRKFLKPPQEVMAGYDESVSAEAAAAMRPPDPAKLEKLASRYQQTVTTPEYNMIAGLTSFQTAHQSLLSYMEMLKRPAAPPQGPPPMPAEGLPAPRPLDKPLTPP